MIWSAVTCAVLLAAGTSVGSAPYQPKEIQVLSRWARQPVPVDGRSYDWSGLRAQYQAPGLSVAALNDSAYLYLRLVSAGIDEPEARAQTDLAATLLPPDPGTPANDAWLPEDLPLFDSLDLPFEDEFDAEALGSLLDLLGLEEWTLAGMNTADWLPELGMLPAGPQEFSQTKSREGVNSVYLLRIPLAGSGRSFGENAGRRTGSLILEFTQKVPGQGAARGGWWEGAPGPEKRVDGGDSWEAEESGPPDDMQSGPASGGHPAWLRLTVQLAETPAVSSGAR